MTFQRAVDHIFPLSGACVNQLETIGWTDGTWFLIFPAQQQGSANVLPPKNLCRFCDGKTCQLF